METNGTEPARRQSEELYVCQGTDSTANDDRHREQRDIAGATKIILRSLGEDPDREGLRKTPERFAAAMQFLTQGYRMRSEKLLNEAMFDVAYDDLVIVKDINIFSLCEHHLLPFGGKVHIGYVPDGRVLGLSKLVRLTDVFARRLQIQERLAKEIAEALQNDLNPKGVAVIVECWHMCMQMRGVQQTGTTTITQYKTGNFRSDQKVNERFHELLKT